MEASVYEQARQDYSPAIALPQRDFLPNQSLVGETTLETLTSEHGEFNLDHVEPTAMLGSVMKFPRLQQSVGFVRRERCASGTLPAFDVYLLTPQLWKPHFAQNPLRSDLDRCRQ
jgi:hypothetical protein